MPAQDPHQPYRVCPACGYDMRDLLSVGIRRCPECGKTVPRGIFLHIEPKHATWYIAAFFIAMAPATAAIMGSLFFAAAHSLRLLELRDDLATAWVIATPIYCYFFTLVFCGAHRLPRAAFGALPVSVPVSLANFFVALAAFPSQ